LAAMSYVPEGRVDGVAGEDHDPGRPCMSGRTARCRPTVDGEGGSLLEGRKVTRGVVELESAR